MLNDNGDGRQAGASCLSEFPASCLDLLMIKIQIACRKLTVKRGHARATVDRMVRASRIELTAAGSVAGLRRTARRRPSVRDLLSGGACVGCGAWRLANAAGANRAEYGAPTGPCSQPARPHPADL